jgi:hypothetical protein
MAVTAGASVVACGDFAGSRSSGRTFGTETWYEAEPGASGTEVVVRFDGPAASGTDECAPERKVLVDTTATEVRVTVQRFAPSPVMTCPSSTQTMSATLSEPLGDRPLVNPQTGWRFQANGDRLVLDPDSTPCGRADCSAPAVALASCNPFEYKAVVDEQLRPGKAPDENVRCDGSFLTLTRDGRKAWLVNREATWKVVTRDHRGCDDVWRMTRVRFPAALCA